jgi:hypothetical protein
VNKPMQKARAGMSVDDDRLALYTAARAFFWGQWVGAMVITLGYTQFVYAIASGAYPSTVAAVAGVATLVLGGWMYYSSKRYWDALQITWRNRAVQVALVFAWSGPVFWGMFALGALLVVLGVPLF